MPRVIEAKRWKSEWKTFYWALRSELGFAGQRTKGKDCQVEGTVGVRAQRYGNTCMP